MRTRRLLSQQEPASCGNARITSDVMLKLTEFFFLTLLLKQRAEVLHLFSES